MTMQQDSMGYAVQVADWIDGECLTGWCGRYHSTFGHDWRRTGEQLFGRGRAAALRDLPVGLDRFCKVTKGLLGDPMHVLRSHTSIGFYWPFLNEVERQRVLDAALPHDALPTSRVLGSAGLRMGQHHPLRHCPLCAQECVRNHLEPTRFLDHQLPGSWICTWHDCLLEVETNPRNQWSPPAADGISTRLRAMSARERGALHLCARLGKVMPTLDHVDQDSLRMACMQRLTAFGISSIGRINSSRVDEWFSRSAIGQWLHRNPDVYKLPGKGWIRSMLRAGARSQPLRWILLWAALWERNSTAEATEAFLDIAPDSYSFGLFSNRVAARHWAPVRPSAPQEIQVAFDTAETIAEAAELAGIREAVAVQWLFDDPVLSHRWQARRTRARNISARDRLLAYVADHPQATLKDLANRWPQEMRWLSNHSPATIEHVRRSLAEYRIEAPILELAFAT
jgi:hypothetical protein